MRLRRLNTQLLSSRLPLWVVAMVCVCLQSCKIEPPLKLADKAEVEIYMPEVITELSVVWDVDPNWLDNWWYGWDYNDISLWGDLDYPVPSNYEARFYYLGEAPGGECVKFDGLTVMGSSIRRKFELGYHDMLIWSNIDSEDGTQVVAIDERDIANIRAYTSLSRVSYAVPYRAGGKTYNCPEIFYNVHERDFHVTNDPADYDYFDEDRNVWVRRFSTTLNPVVYIYLVQFVVYNNNGKIIGVADDSAITSLADGVNLNSGVTSDTPAAVTFGMRLKKDLPARNGKKADIVGGKLTTFGLCGMQPWVRSRGSRYDGEFTSLRNDLMLKLSFSNAIDSVFTYNVTEQLQQRAHGGVITIEVDADTITLPSRPPGGGGSSGGFDPTVESPELVESEIEM